MSSGEAETSSGEAEVSSGEAETSSSEAEVSSSEAESDQNRDELERTRASRIREMSHRKDRSYCCLTKGRDGNPTLSWFWGFDGWTIVPGFVRRTDTQRRGMEWIVPIPEWLGTVRYGCGLRPY